MCIKFCLSPAGAGRCKQYLGETSASNQSVFGHAVIVLPWNNPNVLAAVTQANRIGKVKTYPYQKFLRYDPR